MSILGLAKTANAFVADILPFAYAPWVAPCDVLSFNRVSAAGIF